MIVWCCDMVALGNGEREHTERGEGGLMVTADDYDALLH